MIVSAEYLLFKVRSHPVLLFKFTESFSGFFGGVLALHAKILFLVHCLHSYFELFMRISAFFLPHRHHPLVFAFILFKQHFLELLEVFLETFLLEVAVIVV